MFRISWSFIGLSKHLIPDQPIYGLQARVFVDDEWCTTTFDDIALDYIEQIRRIHPHGPYRLLRYSLGGKMAHAMASHLERQGEQETLPATIDTRPTERNQVALDPIDETHGEVDIQLYWRCTSRKFKTVL